MKKITLGICLCLGSLLLFGIVSRVGAIEAEESKADREEQKATKAADKEVRQDIKATVTARPTPAKKLLGTRAFLTGAKITEKSTNSITVTTSDEKTVVVTLDGNTQLRRRFWGKATLDEMSVGDSVLVIGKWSDEAQTKVMAKLIRDLSIQKRYGVFFGTVTQLDVKGWTMDTLKRGSQTITVSSSTKFVNRKGETIQQKEIIQEHRVRVKGLWNSQLDTITEVTQVKDYTIPAKVTGTPTPTVKPTPKP